MLAVRGSSSVARRARPQPLRTASAAATRDNGLLGDAIRHELEAVVRPRLRVVVAERDEPLDVRLQLVLGHVQRESLSHERERGGGLQW